MNRSLPPRLFRFVAVLLIPLSWLSLSCDGAPTPQDGYHRYEEMPRMQALHEGRHRLKELPFLVERFAELEAWDKIIHIELPTQENFSEMILTEGGVDFQSNGIDVDLEVFRKEAARLSLTPEALTGGIQVSPDVENEAPIFVEIRGEWSHVAHQVIQLIKGIYGAREEDEVVVTLYR